MKIYLIRHGDPDYEKDSLTDKGHQEAQELAYFLKSEGISKIYSSPLGRARDTAHYTAELLGLDVNIELWTAELSLRCIEPQNYAAWNVHGVDVRTPDYLESPLDYEKVKALPADKVLEIEAKVRNDSDLFLARIGYEREGANYRILRGNSDRIALFCHGGFGLTWLSTLLEIPMPIMWAGFFLHTSSVTQILFDERKPGIASPRCIMMSALPHMYNANLKPNISGIVGNYD